MDGWMDGWTDRQTDRQKDSRATNNTPFFKALSPMKHEQPGFLLEPRKLRNLYTIHT